MVDVSLCVEDNPDTGHGYVLTNSPHYKENTVDYGLAIHDATFEQVLELDEDPDDREFSCSFVFNFLE